MDDRRYVSNDIKIYQSFCCFQKWFIFLRYLMTSIQIYQMRCDLCHQKLAGRGVPSRWNGWMTWWGGCGPRSMWQSRRSSMTRHGLTQLTGGTFFTCFYFLVQFKGWKIWFKLASGDKSLVWQPCFSVTGLFKILTWFVEVTPQLQESLPGPFKGAKLLDKQGKLETIKVNTWRSSLNVYRFFFFSALFWHVNTRSSYRRPY